MTRSFASLALACALLSVGTACESFDIEPYLPTVSFNRMDVNSVDWEGISADFVFAVNNPNPLTIDLARFNYALAFEEVEWLSGDSPDGLTLEAAGSTDLALPVDLEFTSLYEMVQALRGQDNIGFGLDGSFGFNTDLGPVDLPFSEDGDFPAPRRPKFALDSVKIREIDFTSADLRLKLNIDNDHGSNLLFRNVDYAVSLAGVDVGGGFIDELGEVTGANTQTVNIPITVNFLDVGTAVYDILQGQKLDVDFLAEMDVDTPFGALPLSVDERGNITVEQ